MCQIAVCEKRPLTEKEIEEFWRSNSDGVGLAWIEGKKVHYKKGFMKMKEFISWYLPRAYELGLHVVHFRLKSAGEEVQELTHPFPITDHFNLSLEGFSDAVLFHNGTVSDYKEYLILLSLIKGVKIPRYYSDSSVMAVLVHYVGENILHEGHNRFAILRPDGVKLFGSWRSENGILLSSYRYGYTYWKKEDDLFEKYKGY